MTHTENFELLMNANKVLKINTDVISNQPTRSFAQHLNDTRFPGEYLDMLLKRVAVDLSKYDYLATEQVTFGLVLKSVRKHTGLSTFSCLKLANVYCQIQYSFQISAYRYYLNSLVNK